jgi:hypothetical protein
MAEKDILVFVEEASAFEVVRAPVKKMELAERATILKHKGAGDLERSLRKKIAADPFPNSKFLIAREADNLNCCSLKSKLIELVPEAKRDRTLVRIVCQELEAWYLAQSENLASTNVLRKPIPGALLKGDVDLIRDPERIFLRHAHERGQIELATRIGAVLDPESKRSSSFRNFVAALRRLASMP